MRNKLTALTVLLSLSVVISVYAVIHVTIPNRARVKGVGVSIWWDHNCTNPVSAIDWGIIELNETKSTVLYVRSQSNVDITLSLTTENWNHTNASRYIDLSWNHTGTPLTPKSVTPIEFYLHVSHNVTEIDHFSFDIIIYAEG